jgi:Tfp pilus assembly protein PilN
VLPAEHRRFSSRAAFIPTLVLTGLVLLAAVGAAVYSSYADRKYLRKLEAEIALYEPQAQRVATVDRQMSEMQARARVLDQFRQQTRRDLDALNELTKLVEPPAWVSSTTLTRDTARITGEAPQAPPLLKILDSSPLFEGSTPDSILRSQSGAGETFMIHMNRRAGK